MRQRKLPGVELVVSAFSFGTASLHHLSSEAERQRLLSAAADAGFSHFDTAPLYGFGIAERSLAPLLAARKDLTVATKLGLYPPGGASQSAAAMVARKLAGKIWPKLSRAEVDWGVARARQSFEGSLRRLGRDRVDILFLHEPAQNLIKTDEWLSWLATVRDRFGYLGVAGDATHIAPYLTDVASFGAIVQVADSMAGREADVVLDAGRPLQLTYGYIAADRNAPAAHTLSLALQRNATGSVLVSTRQIARLATYAHAGA